MSEFCEAVGGPWDGDQVAVRPTGALLVRQGAGRARWASPSSNGTYRLEGPEGRPVFRYHPIDHGDPE